MKVGVRKLNINKSISAKTKGKMTRKIKKKFNPYYGTKGTGQLHPKKKSYNAVCKWTIFFVLNGC